MASKKNLLLTLLGCVFLNGCVVEKSLLKTSGERYIIEEDGGVHEIIKRQLEESGFSEEQKDGKRISTWWYLDNCPRGEVDYGKNKSYDESKEF